MTDVTFDASGNPTFTLISAYDNYTLSYSSQKASTEAWTLYSISYGLNNVSINLYERSYGSRTFRLASTNNQTVTWNTISDTTGKIDFNITGPTAARIWLGDIGQPYQVLRDGAVWTDWSWDATTKMLNVNVPGSEIALIWQLGGGGGTGGGTATSGAATGAGYTFLPPPPPIIAGNVLVNFGLLIIVVVIGASLFYSQVEARRERKLSATEVVLFFLTADSFLSLQVEARRERKLSAVWKKRTTSVAVKWKEKKRFE
jgi:hypothetical protein